MGQEHYFTADPKVASRPRTIPVVLPDLRFELDTDRGVFAHGHLDFGTDLLLRSLPPVPPGELVDIGCGYGAIAIALALRCPDARVWAVDINHRALDLCARNAERAGAPNVVPAEPAAVPERIRFAAAYSNPPVRLGKPALHDLLVTWIGKLEPDAIATLVVQRHLGADSLAAWLTGLGHRVDRVRSKGGYRVLAVHAPTGSTHDGSRVR
ncbi:MAG TPA: methyltransferase [Candidatus Saccharimonadales bacterium]|nr:methyltransferase [Candidatus Saccharimonadales bacterium]